MERGRYGSKDLVCVTLGTGVGGGVIVNGDIVQGISGAGGEIGHITAIPFGGNLVIVERQVV